MNPIVLGTIAGSRLNLDGDQGNLLALRRYLSAAGFSVEFRSVASTAAALDCHFLLFGHGSVAAMASLDEMLAAIDWAAVSAGVPGLVVGSGFEWLASHDHVNERISRTDRESEFQVADLGPLRVLGYRNTDSGLPNLAMNGNLICTMLHGPVLAKNPKLLDRAARAAVAAAGKDWPMPSPEPLTSWVETLNRVCARIWELEAEEVLDPAKA